MQESQEVREAWLEFCDRLSAGDVDSFERVVSSHPAALVIGTAPGEWVTERDQLRYGFEAEGVGLEPAKPVGYEEGALAWLVDEPSFTFPDGSSMQTRFTVIMLREDDRWKVVHMHASVGIPDEEVIGLQERWGTAAA